MNKKQEKEQALEQLERIEQAVRELKASITAPSVPEPNEYPIPWPSEQDEKISSLHCKITNYFLHAKLMGCPDFKPDWDDADQDKWYPHLNHTTDGIKVETIWRTTIQGYTEVYFDTKEHANQAGEWVKPLVLELNELMKAKR